MSHRYHRHARETGERSFQQEVYPGLDLSDYWFSLGSFFPSWQEKPSRAEDEDADALSDLY